MYVIKVRLPCGDVLVPGGSHHLPMSQYEVGGGPKLEGSPSPAGLAVVSDHRLISLCG